MCCKQAICILPGQKDVCTEIENQHCPLFVKKPPKWLPIRSGLVSIGLLRPLLVQGTLI